MPRTKEKLVSSRKEVCDAEQKTNVVSFAHLSKEKEVEVVEET